jgi:hypothetical protein
MAVTMKNAVIWDVAPCGSLKNRRFGGTSVLTRVTWRNIPEDGILHVNLNIALDSYFTSGAQCRGNHR